MLKDRLRGYIGRLSEQQLLESVRDSRTSMYYAQLVQLRSLLWEVATSERQYAEKTPDRNIPKHKAWCETYQEYLGELVVETSEGRQKLKAVVDEALCFRIHVKHAVRSGDLDDTTLVQLKRKFEALQEQFPEAHSIIYRTHQSLIDPADTYWW